MASVRRCMQLSAVLFAPRSQAIAPTIPHGGAVRRDCVVTPMRPFPTPLTDVFDQAGTGSKQ